MHGIGSGAGPRLIARQGARATAPGVVILVVCLRLVESLRRFDLSHDLAPFVPLGTLKLLDIRLRPLQLLIIRGEDG